jgi:hypothetical protein
MDWVGEALREKVHEDSTLWLAAVDDKVAALGGHLDWSRCSPIRH